MKRKAVAICNAKRPCRGLTSLIQQHARDGAGFKVRLMFNLKAVSAKPIPMYIVRSRASDRGIALNFCPFCGESINERWTKASPRAADQGTEGESK